MRSARRAGTTELRDDATPELWGHGGARGGLGQVGGNPDGLEFRRVPLLAAAVWFAVGEGLGRGGRPAVLLVSALVLLAGLCGLARRRALRVALLPLAGAWVVVGMWSAQVQPVASRQETLVRYADGLSRVVRGRVVRVRMLPPRSVAAAASVDEDRDTTQWQEAELPGAMSVDVAVEAVEEVTPDLSRMVPVEGGVRMTLLARGGVQVAGSGGQATLPELHCGNAIEGAMQLRTSERYRDPGAWQYADYLLDQGIGVRANVAVAKLHLLGSEAGGGRGKWTVNDVGQWACRVFAAQSWAAGRLDGYVNSAANRRLPQAMRLNRDDAAMLKAMLFGERTSLTQTQRVGFQRTGSFHLFVVSGMHVTLLAGAVFWLARRLRVREGVATALTLGPATGYAVLTGFGAPVQRALWMTGLFLVARLLSRERSVLNGLGAAALGVLVWSPASLFDASFQMTFLAVMAIGGIAVPLGERSLTPWSRATRDLGAEWKDVRTAPRVAQFRVMLRVWGEAWEGVLGRWAYGVPAGVVRVVLWGLELSLLGLVVEAVMVLPMAVYFHRATPFALPANMLSVPMVAVLAPLGGLTFVMSLGSVWLAMLPGAATALLVHAVRGTVEGMSHVRVADLQVSDVRVPGPAVWVMVVAVVVWGLCCWMVRRRGAGWGWATALVLPAVAALVLWPETAVVSAGQLEVTALDVGQGDSLLVVSPDGATMLVDAGGPVGGVKEAAEAQAGFDVGEEIVSPYLWSRRIRRLDVMVLSHAHSDHMGGMAAVMRNFRPRELWVSGDAGSVAYQALLVEAAELGVVVRRYRAEDAVRWSGVDVKVLAPAFAYVNEGEPRNDDSLVLRLEYGKASVLLEGDAEAASERAMVASDALRPVTLLKVGHHGSRSSTTEAFLAQVAPQDAVVSVGRNNRFGHPRYEVIERIAERGTRLYRTDEMGLTTFVLDRDGAIRAVAGESN